MKRLLRKLSALQVSAARDRSDVERAHVLVVFQLKADDERLTLAAAHDEEVHARVAPSAVCLDEENARVFYSRHRLSEEALDGGRERAVFERVAAPAVRVFEQEPDRADRRRAESLFGGAAR